MLYYNMKSSTPNLSFFAIGYSLIGLFCLCLYGQLTAQSITSIQITGNHHYPQQKIRERIQSQIGDSIQRNQLNRDLKAIFQTGRFQQIEFLQQPNTRGADLFIKLQEYPVIEHLQIQSSELAEEQQSKLIQQYRNQVYSRALLKQIKQQAQAQIQKNGYIDVQVDGSYATSTGTIHIQTSSAGRFRIAKIIYRGLSQKEKELFRSSLNMQTGLFFSKYFSIPAYQKELAKIQQYFHKQGYLQVRINDRKKGWQIVGNDWLPISRVRVSFHVEKGQKTYYHPFTVQTQPKRKILTASPAHVSGQNPMILPIETIWLTYRVFGKVIQPGQIVEGEYSQNLQQLLIQKLRKQGHLLAKVHGREKQFILNAHFISHFRNCQQIPLPVEQEKCRKKKQQWNFPLLRQLYTSHKNQRFSQVQFRVNHYGPAILESFAFTGFSQQLKQKILLKILPFQHQEADPKFWQALQDIRQQYPAVKFFFHPGSQKKFTHVVLKQSLSQ